MIDELIESLLADLSGQIRLALTDKFYATWGLHYLLSTHEAYTKQRRLSFRDPGQQHYGSNSPLFIKCKKHLNNLFDTLPPPTVPPAHSKDPSTVIVMENMSQYNDVSSKCFAATCAVKLKDGEKVKAVTLQRGMEVLTPIGPKKVEAILMTKVKDKKMCRIGDLLITPWHPIRVDNKWIYPNDIAKETILHSGTICSILLEECTDDMAHGVYVEGHWVVTLGHGLTHSSTEGDRRPHADFGDRRTILESLQDLPKSDGLFFKDL